MALHLTHIFQNHVPPTSVGYCVDLATRFPIRLVLRGARRTKIGDFRPVKDGPGVVTVNRELNPYLFLITYVHEVAHAWVHIEFGARTLPHGNPWKLCFRELMKPLLTEAVFPARLLEIVKSHLRNPKASTFADVRLTRALREFDTDDGLKPLAELPEGALFTLNRRTYKKGGLRRTRVLCHQVGTRRRYLISGEARVTEQESVEVLKC